MKIEKNYSVTEFTNYMQLFPWENCFDLIANNRKQCAMNHNRGDPGFFLGGGTPLRNDATD